MRQTFQDISPYIPPAFVNRSSVLRGLLHICTSIILSNVASFWAEAEAEKLAQGENWARATLVVSTSDFERQICNSIFVYCFNMF